MKPINYQKIYHQIRMECIRLQKEINSTKTLTSKTHQNDKLQHLEHQLAELKKEYLEQELHHRLNNLNS